MPAIDFTRSVLEADLSGVSVERAANILAEQCEETASLLQGVANGRRHSQDFHVSIQLALLQCSLELCKRALNIDEATDKQAMHLLDSTAEYMRGVNKS